MEGGNWKRVYDGNLIDSLWVKGNKNDVILNQGGREAPCEQGHPAMKRLPPEALLPCNMRERWSFLEGE